MWPCSSGKVRGYSLLSPWVKQQRRQCLNKCSHSSAAEAHNSFRGSMRIPVLVPLFRPSFISALQCAVPRAFTSTTNNMGQGLSTRRSATTKAGCPVLVSLQELQLAQAQLGGPAYKGLPPLKDQQAYFEALNKMDWDAVKSDLKQLMRDSREFWPADYGHYGGLFIRTAWHATGTYRQSDGRGGAEGGLQRFEPELSWPDNANVCKAHRLLEPIKQKYGLGLSWGDLIVLAGTVAIEDMGGPVLGFAAGRIDHVDNSQSIFLGPSEEQEKFKAMQDNDGKLEFPLGQNTMGLIYVNPEGPMGKPDPQGAADTIRDVFGRMGMGDRENVALIGGGHTFGKSHGAAPTGPGKPPKECPQAPYEGTHGTGKGNDTITSGIEGPWTANPTRWDNDYFKYLINFEWEPHKGPGGAWQWRVKGSNGPKAPMAHGDGKQDVMMMTTDIALSVDKEYRKYVEEFAADEQAFAKAFAEVWYKLVNRDIGPFTRMLGPDIAPPQDWQFPLPPPPKKLADPEKVVDDIEDMIDQGKLEIPELVRLARNSAGTYRHTDHLGGVNGARIRFSPGKDWEPNKGLDKTLKQLEPIKERHGEGLSWADLIVLAGTVAVKKIGALPDLPFCPGRTDAENGKGWEPLEYLNKENPKSHDDVLFLNELRTLSNKEFVALSFPDVGGVDGLKHLLETDDEPSDIYMHTIKYSPEVRTWVHHYIGEGDDTFKKDFGAVWSKMMNIDCIDGQFAQFATPTQI